MALTEAEELELLELEALESGVELPPTEPTTLAGKALNIVKNVGSYPMGLPANISKISKPVLSGDVEKSYFELMPRMEKGAAVVKGAVDKSIGNILSSGKLGSIQQKFPNAVGSAGALASLGAQAVPFEPSSFALGALPKVMGGTGTISKFPKSGGGEIDVGVKGAMSYVFDKLPKSISNRFLKTPSSIALPRLEKGKLTTGEEFLGSEAFNPKEFGKLAIGDKEKIYKISNDEISKLGKEVDAEIGRLFEKGRTPNVPEVKIKGTPQLEYKPTEIVDVRPAPMVSGQTIRLPVGPVERGGINMEPLANTPVATEIAGQTGKIGESLRSLKNLPETPFTGFKKQPAVKTSEIADAINPSIEEAINVYGKDSWTVKRLQKFKDNFQSGKPEYLDFKSLNKLREDIGANLGKKGFGKNPDELTEQVFAQRLMFSKIRDLVGSMSPKLNKLLNQQHMFFDIRDSVSPVAAKGYEDVPRSISNLFGMNRSPKVASMIKGLPKNRIPPVSSYPVVNSEAMR